MLHWLGIKPSYSRPRVSDDNALVESLFRTAKYRPEFPTKGFADLEAARQWAATFVHWYNHDHRHSGKPHATACRPGLAHPAGTPCAVSAGAPSPSITLERPDPKLEADRSVCPESGERQRRDGCDQNSDSRVKQATTTLTCTD